MNVTQLFFWYLKYVWPVHRLIISDLSRRCNNCILSERYCDINEQGLCAECEKYYNIETLVDKHPDSEHIQRQHQLDHILSGCNGKGQYDATLLLSGGKDSTYLLYRLRQQYPHLKLLCLMINNGFMAPSSERNARVLTTRLNVDLLIVNSYIDHFKEVFKRAFLGLKGQESYSIIDRVDGETIFACSEAITRSMGIGLLIGGLSWVQIEKILNSIDFEFDKNGVKSVYPLAVWQKDEQGIRRVVRENNLMVNGSDSPVVSNNKLIPTMCALDIKALGYCSFEPEFAQLVREGKTSRKVWLYTYELLEYITLKGYLDREIRNTLSLFGLRVDQVLGKLS